MEELQNYFAKFLDDVKIVESYYEEDKTEIEETHLRKTRRLTKKFKDLKKVLTIDYKKNMRLNNSDPDKLNIIEEEYNAELDDLDAQKTEKAEKLDAKNMRDLHDRQTEYYTEIAEYEEILYSQIRKCFPTVTLDKLKNENDKLKSIVTEYESQIDGLKKENLRLSVIVNEFEKI